MTRYLISFDAGAMDHIPHAEMPAVGKASHAVVQEAVDACVWVFGGGLETKGRVSWPPTGRSPTACTRRPRRLSADSRSWTCPHARRRWRGLPRSPWPAAVRNRYGSSCPTPNKTRCSARLIGDGDVPRRLIEGDRPRWSKTCLGSG
jgi:hypothetical protein